MQTAPAVAPAAAPSDILQEIRCERSQPLLIWDERACLCYARHCRIDKAGDRQYEESASHLDLPDGLPKREMVTALLANFKIKTRSFVRVCPLAK